MTRGMLAARIYDVMFGECAHSREY